MSIEIVMPQMGESIAEGTITKWLKKPGESVERDEPLFEITTDKVDTEVPSPAAGVLERILVSEDQTVAVGTVVAVVQESGASAGAASEPSSDASAVKSGQSTNQSPGAGHFRESHEPLTFERQGSSEPSKPAPSSGASTEGSRRTKLSPVVAALAAEHAIGHEELMSIPGSGRGGRITKKDVLRYLDNRPRSSAPREAAAVSASVSAPSATSGDARSTAPRAEPPPQYVYQPEADDELVPLTRMQQQIAEHMHWSRQISAQVTSFAECDVHRIVRFRDEHQGEWEKSAGVPLSFLPFVGEVVVRALKEFPVFNASLVGEHLAYKKHVHLGVSLALDEGLVTPVIRNADEMNFVGLARNAHALEEKARARRLAREDVVGATFTITNPGMFGGLMGTPMIAQPQLAVLGLGAVQKRPVVVDDAIAIRPVMVLALSFDHRVIDGATGFQFLERIRTLLELFELPTL